MQCTHGQASFSPAVEDNDLHVLGVDLFKTVMSALDLIVCYFFYCYTFLLSNQNIMVTILV